MDEQGEKEGTNQHKREKGKKNRESITPLFEYVKLPLGKKFRSAPDLVKTSIMKQTILFYTECRLNFMQYIKFLFESSVEISRPNDKTNKCSYFI